VNISFLENNTSEYFLTFLLTRWQQWKKWIGCFNHESSWTCYV